MLTNISIRNWQSLRELDLELGRFTVIVGASSSGKTALIRALRAAANNPRRKGNITRGAKAARVTIVTDRHEIVYERTENTALYRLSGFDKPFTDLAGAVPEQITAALGIPPAAAGQSLNFAGQFDAPFLLDESGAAVARRLGELTNVNIVFGGVKEGNRRRTALSATLKTRQADLEAARVQAGTFADLPAQLAAVDAAQHAAAGAQDLDGRLSRLRAATDSLIVAESVLRRSQVPQIPDVTGLEQAVARRSRFAALTQQLRAASVTASTAGNAVEHAEADVQALHDQLHAVLAEAGTCPTCGQHVAA